MKIRLLLLVVSLLAILNSKAQDTIQTVVQVYEDTLFIPTIDILPEDSMSDKHYYTDSLDITPELISAILPDSLEFKEKRKFEIHYMAFLSNPLFGELVYMGKNIDLEREKPKFSTLYFGEIARPLNAPVDLYTEINPLDTLIQLRLNAIDTLFRHDFTVFKKTYRELPKIDWNKMEPIDPFDEPMIIVQSPVIDQSIDKRIIQKKKISPWKGRMDGAVQFSQNAVSDNWYKGGYSNLSFLTIISGSINYDNKKKMKWENGFEWRSGINTIPDDIDSVRNYIPNDDIFKIVSKFNVKATGNFYYSGNAELQTQFFNNPAAVNSYELKAKFLTPITINIGVGMDYQYKWLSVAISPIAYKYIYLSDTTVTKKGEYINPNTFGIEAGQNHRKDFGSELKVIVKDYQPLPEIKLNSTFKFFTNYKSVIFDWEIVAELRINRFLSTRLLLNPRFDNSIIVEDGERVKIQMKEMITVGISYRLL